MMAAARPHKPSFPGKPEVCPHCQEPYAWRVRPREDNHPVDGYRHTDGGWVYVHTNPDWPEGVLKR